MRCFGKIYWSTDHENQVLSGRRKPIENIFVYLGSSEQLIKLVLCHIVLGCSNNLVQDPCINNCHRKYCGIHAERTWMCLKLLINAETGLAASIALVEFETNIVENFNCFRLKKCCDDILRSSFLLRIVFEAVEIKNLRSCVLTPPIK